MKTLFTADHAAWLFLASFPVLAGGLALSWPWLTAVGILVLYVSFDVLGYKWVLHQKRHIVHDPDKVFRAMIAPMPRKTVVDLLREAQEAANISMTYSVSPIPETAILAYRLIQHGLMLPVLTLAWISVGPVAVIVPAVVWLTYGADALYHPVARAPYASWNSRTYYNHGYWTVVGWFYWIPAKLRGEEPEIIPAYAMYLQAIAGGLVAVGVLVWG